MHQNPRKRRIPTPQELLQLEARAKSGPEPEIDDSGLVESIVNVAMESKTPSYEDSLTQSEIESSAEDFLAELSKLTNLEHLKRVKSRSSLPKSENEDTQQTKRSEGEDGDSSGPSLPGSGIDSKSSSWSWTSQYDDSPTPSWDSQFQGSWHSALSLPLSQRSRETWPEDEEGKEEETVEEGVCEHDPESDSWMMCSECCTCGSHTSQLTLSQLLRCFNGRKYRAKSGGEENCDKGKDAASGDLKGGGIEARVEVEVEAAEGDDEESDFDEDELDELSLAAGAVSVMIAMLWWVERTGGLF